MVPAVLALVGALLGLAAGPAGLPIGAAIGYLIGRDVQSRGLRSRIESLERTVEFLRRPAARQQTTDEPDTDSWGCATVFGDPRDPSRIASSFEPFAEAGTKTIAPNRDPNPNPHRNTNPNPHRDPSSNQNLSPNQNHRSQDLLHGPHASAGAKPRLRDLLHGQAPSPATVPRPARPPEPSWVTVAVARARTWLLTGNSPVKIGIILSLIGLGFLLREAAVRGWVDLTIEMRLAAAAVFGFALLAFGWHQRTKRPIYGLSLQGGGIAVLYLVTLASYALYDLLGAPVALAAVVLITVAAGALAMVQNSLTLAMLGLIGGFSAPLLAFAWPQDHFEVFGFYAVLGVAVVAVSRLKAWPTLVLSGYAFTFVVAGLWLLARQDDSDWVQLQPFVAFFVLLYALVPLVWPPVASSRPEPIGFKDAWNAPLVFCTPFAGLAMQALLVGHMRYGVAISSAVLALAHVALRELARNLRPADKQLVVAYTALAVAFSATAVPLFLGASATSAIWAVQGAVLVWASARWGSRLALVGGAVLQAAAAVAYVVRIAAASTDWDSPAVFGFWAEATPVLNPYSLGAVMLAASGLASAEFLRRSSHLEDWHPWPQNMALVWGAGWFLFAETAAVWLRLGLMPAVGLWAVQGAALMWVASKRRSMPVAVAGIAMQVAASIAAALKMADDAANLSPGSFEFWADSLPVVNQYFAVTALLAICGFASATAVFRFVSPRDDQWRSLPT